MASKQVVALANRLQEEFGIPVDPERFYRTYAGRNQREAGAFSWLMWCKDGVTVVASCERIRKCIVKRNRLDLHNRYPFIDWEIELFAYAPGEPGYEKSEQSDEDFVAGIVTLQFDE